MWLSARLFVIGITVLVLAACGGGNRSDSHTGTSPPGTKTFLSHTSGVGDNYNTVVQQLYVAYFGRPADVTGLTNFKEQLASIGGPSDIQGMDAAYSSNNAVRGLIDSFGNSAESNALYSGDNSAFVTAIYRNVLNRAPDPDGMQFWVAAIDRGVLTRPRASFSIMAGALVNTTPQGLIDARLVANRLTVATNFTHAISNPAVYSGDEAAGIVRDMLRTVTESTDPDAFGPKLQETLDKLAASNSGGQPITRTAPSVGIDPGVPVAAAQGIDSILSNIGEAKPGTALAIASVPGNEDVLLIAEAANKPMLIGFTAGDVNLGVDSTALALVRMAAGITEGVSNTELVTAIRAAGDYPKLTAEVNNALAAGTSPLESQAVIDAVWVVAAQVPDLLKKQVPNLLAEVKVNGLPHYLISDAASSQVWLDKYPSALNNLSLNNRTAIHWTASSFAAGVSPTVVAIGPRKTTARQLLFLFSGSESVQAVPVFDPLTTIRLAQDKASRDRNINHALTKFFVLMFDISGKAVIGGKAANLFGDLPQTGECIDKLAAWVQSERLSQFGEQADGTAALGYVLAAFVRKQFFREVYNEFMECLKTKSMTQQIPGIVEKILPENVDEVAQEAMKESGMPVMKHLLTVFEIYKAVHLGRSIKLTTDAISQTFYYYGRTEDVDVCMSSGVFIKCETPANPGGSVTVPGPGNTCTKPTVYSYKVEADPDRQNNYRSVLYTGCFTAGITIEDETCISHLHDLPSQQPSCVKVPPLMLNQQGIMGPLTQQRAVIIPFLGNLKTLTSTVRIHMPDGTVETRSVSYP